MKINIKNNFSTLEAVVLGIADSCGGEPNLDETYDPATRESLEAGRFPSEDSLKEVLAKMEAILKKYRVQLFRPMNILRLNQIFARDIGFVIDSTFIISNIIPDRYDEIKGIEHVLKEIPQSHVLRPTPDIRIEGSDVILWQDHIFVGYSKDQAFKELKVARTNLNAIDFLKTHFTNYKVLGFEIMKSDKHAFDNALHLDCCFLPLNPKHAIICPEAFKNPEELKTLIACFEPGHLIEINLDERAKLMTGLFIIRPDVIVSDVRFERINEKLTALGFTIETLNFAQLTKLSGSIRSTVLPLRRR